MRLEVVCRDRIGIAQEILAIMVEHKITLASIETDPRRNVFLSFRELDFSELQILLPELRRIEGVTDVRTVPFTPVERSQIELTTMLQSMPEPVFSIDDKARIVKVNTAGTLALRMDKKAIIGQGLNHFIHGFSFQRWLEKADVNEKSVDLSLGSKRYVGLISPINITSSLNGEGHDVLAGAIVVLKSSQRMQQRYSKVHSLNSNSFEHIHFKSPQMANVVEQAKKMADLAAPLLIQGETGTGKEILARACHDSSSRKDHPFIALNCASLPDDVAESELFGHAEPSETNTEYSRGVLEAANGGTVFLDDICEMSPSLQVKFLRFLHDGTFRRVGEEQEIQVDVRIICSTQKDLADLIQQGDFREDLFYRINVLNLVVPPLRERKTDILPLADYFVEKFCAQNNRASVVLGKSCRDYLTQYPWPGNVRQLENALYRAINLNEGDELSADDLKLPAYASSFGYFDEAFDGNLDEAIKRFESSLLRRLYPAYPSTRQLAKKLGVSHTAIANKLREYGINKNTVN